MNAILRELLTDVRDFLDERLDEEIDSNSTPGKTTRKAKKRTMDANALADIAPLERLLDRVTEALADDRGGGI